MTTDFLLLLGLVASVHAACSLVASPAPACTHTIAVNGSDSGSGPFATLQFVVNATAAANQTAVVVCYQAGQFDASAFTATVPLFEVNSSLVVQLRGSVGTVASAGVSVVSAIMPAVVSLVGVDVVGAVVLRTLEASIEASTVRGVNSSLVTLGNDLSGSDLSAGQTHLCSVQIDNSAVRLRGKDVVIAGSSIGIYSALASSGFVSNVSIVDSLVIGDVAAPNDLNFGGALLDLRNVTIANAEHSFDVTLSSFTAYRLTLTNVSGEIFSGSGWSLTESAVTTCPPGSTNTSTPFFSDRGFPPQGDACTQCVKLVNTTLPGPCPVRCPSGYAIYDGLFFCVPCPAGLAPASNQISCTTCGFGLGVTTHGCLPCSERQAWSNGTCEECKWGAKNFTCTPCTGRLSDNGNVCFDTGNEMTIIIGVASALGGVLVIALIIFIVNRWRKRRTTYVQL